jgi:hypothetical protein
MPMLPMSTVGPGLLAAPAGAQNSSAQAAERGGPRGAQPFNFFLGNKVPLIREVH